MTTSSAHPTKPPAQEPFKHLIEEYRHRAQQVTCTCGWQGSTASPDGRTSDWKAHVTEHRDPKR